MVVRVVMILLFFAVLAGMWVRFGPIDAVAWHIDPQAAEDPGSKGAMLALDDSPVWAESPEVLGEALGDIALATPYTEFVMGDPAAGFMTYVTRSQIFGFPDFTTIRAVETEEGTRLVVLARAQYGQYDLGVNAARIEDWLAQLTQALPPQ